MSLRASMDHKSIEKLMPKGLTWFGASMAQISTMIGAGIVGIPFAYMTLGIPIALAMNLIMIW